MGDYADDAIEDSMQQWLDEIDGSDKDAPWTEDPIDRGVIRRHFTKCKYCGVKGLLWNKIDDKFRLENSLSEIHTCKEYRNKEN